MERKENICLKTSIDISSALNEPSSRLELLNQRCLSIQASLKLVSIQNLPFSNAEHNICRIL